VPHFHAWASSPRVIDSTVYYWGIVGQDIYAVRYAFHDGSSVTTFLTDGSQLLATDNRAQLLPPERRGATFVYATYPGRTFVLGADFTVLSDSTLAAPTERGH
jgi:hypothetical protein